MMKDETMMLACISALGVLYAISVGPKDIAKAAVGAVNDAAAGTVVGLGQVVGIPETNLTQCQIDMAAGNTLNASFSCPAGTFLSYMAGNKP